MPDQAAIVAELARRIDTLPPDKQAIVAELAGRFGVPLAADPGAQMRASAMSKVSPELRGYTPEELAHATATGNPLSPISSVTTRDMLANPYKAGLEEAGAGVAQMSAGTPRDIAGGAHKVISGGTRFVSQPALTLGAVTNPVGTALAVAGGMGAQTATTRGLKAVGVPDEYSDLAGDIAGFAAGSKVGHGVADLQETGGPFMIPDANPSFLPRMAGKVAGAPSAIAGASLGVPEALKFKTRLDPAEAAAVQYGHDQGVQMSTSVLTGSKLARDAEKIVQHLPLAADVAEQARGNERATLAAAGAREVQGIAPDVETVPKPLDAGEALHKAAIDNERAHGVNADDAYGLLRSIEEQPQFKATVKTGTRRVDTGQVDETGAPIFETRPVMEDVQLPVDYRAMKKAVKPLLTEVLRPMSIAQEQSSTGIKAMRNIVDSPDFVSASVADQDLGALKGIMRDSAQSRSVGQAKFAADLLSKQIDTAIERAGPDAVAALKQGRASTVAKYDAQGFQKAIGFSDVGTGRSTPGSAVDLVRKLTADGDRNISLLRQVQEHAPEHLPAIAQSVTQEILDKVIAEAGMGKAQTALTNWKNLGGETKSILYKDPAKVQALTNFFTLAKKINENPNPSGSGSLIAAMKGLGLVIFQPHIGVPMMLGTKPLARMLFTPTGSRNLIAAMKTPASAPGAALLARDILKQAGADGVQPVPATAAGVSTTAAAGAQSQAGGLANGTGQTPGQGQGGALPAAAGTGANAGAPAAGGGASTARTRIEVAGGSGRSYEAEYKLRELADLNPSHNGITFEANPKAKIANERDYSNAVNQEKVIVGSARGRFKPSLHVTDNADLANGPMAVDRDGNVYGGNGRAMILHRVYSGNPEGAAAYRAMIEQKAGQFGLDPAAVRGMKQPVLVREIADSELVGRGKQEAIADFNKKGTAELTPAERAIADSRRVSTATLDGVAAALDEHGHDSTLADVMQGQAGGELLNKLIDDGVLAASERGAYQQKNGELTPAGKSRISDLIVGRFFREPAQLEDIAPAIRNQVERIAAPLAQAEAHTAWNLTPHVQDAITILEQAQKLGIKNLDDFFAQDGIFGKAKYSPEAVDLARAIKLAPAEVLKGAARHYAEDAGHSGANNALFGGTTPEAAFADSFGADAIAARTAEVKAARAVKANALAPAEKPGRRVWVAPDPNSPLMRAAAKAKRDKNALAPKQP